MDGLKEIYDSMTSRLKSHVFGSIAVSFILWNWKVIYVLCFSEMPIFFRFAYFNMNMSNEDLYYWPIGLGLILGLGAPWVNAAAHWIVSIPLSYIKSRDELSVLMREGWLEDKKLEVERKKTAVQDEKLKAVNLVKKQQSAENSLRERQRELTDAEKKLDMVQGQINSQTQKLEELELQVAKAEIKDKASDEAEGSPKLSKIEETILVTASRLNQEVFTFGPVSNLRQFQNDLGDVIPEITSTRAKAEVDDALVRLKALKLAQSGRDGSHTLTSKGYKLADELKQ
ncbi:hypothetical protein [Pacificibacter sp. AS14]|uniref:hypothetical protein n=1 Tax=Pacificibacter sp. AS14 TaxID=3135785 RepID=UPI00316FA493